MKNIKKAIIYGILAIFIFWLLTLFFIPIFSRLIQGDSYEISYHIYTYVGVYALAGLMTGCTTLIVTEIRELKRMMGNDGEEEKNK